jgi:hypothetical protein
MNITYSVPPDCVPLLRRFEHILQSNATSLFMTTLGFEWLVDPAISDDVYFDLFTRSREPTYLAYFSRCQLTRTDEKAFLDALQTFSRTPPPPKPRIAPKQNNEPTQQNI